MDETHKTHILPLEAEQLHSLYQKQGTAHHGCALFDFNLHDVYLITSGK